MNISVLSAKLNSFKSLSVIFPLTPTLIDIPYVGWLVAGLFNVFTQKQGAEIGGQMSRDFKDC